MLRVTIPSWYSSDYYGYWYDMMSVACSQPAETNLKTHSMALGMDMSDVGVVRFRINKTQGFGERTGALSLGFK